MGPMRRKDREIVDPAEIGKIMGASQVGRLGLSMNDQPYVVPVNFAFDRDRIYLHCADTGMKLDFLRTNPRVCFEVDESLGVIPGPLPWLYGFAYRSVIAFGTARILTDPEERTNATKLITAKYAGKEMADMVTKKLTEEYRSALGSRLVLVEIKVESITGKHRETSGTNQAPPA